MNEAGSGAVGTFRKKKVDPNSWRDQTFSSVKPSTDRNSVNNNNKSSIGNQLNQAYDKIRGTFFSTARDATNAIRNNASNNNNDEQADNPSETEDKTNNTAATEEEETDPYALTDQQRLAAANQTDLARANKHSVWRQLSRQLATYDYADAQNRALADAQRMQNSRKNDSDRFEAQRDLQSAALGLLGSMGTAMNGSATGNLMRMLESRNDKENNSYLSQLQQNQDAVENAYQEALNQNNVNRLDVRSSADKATDDIQSDWYANLNNINPRLHDQYWGENEDGKKLEWNLNANTPDTYTGGVPFEALDSYQYDLGYLNQPLNTEEARYRGSIPTPSISGYILPDSTVRSIGAQANPSKTRNTVGPRNDYFAEMMNRFNGYRTRRR